PRAREKTREARRKRQRPPEEGTKGRIPEPAQSNRGDAVSSRGEVGRSSLDASLARKRRGPDAQDRRRDDRVDGGGWRRHLGTGRESRNRRRGTGGSQADVRGRRWGGERRRQQRRNRLARRHLPRRFDRHGQVPAREGREARRPQ